MLKKISLLSSAEFWVDLFVVVFAIQLFLNFLSEMPLESVPSSLDPDICPSLSELFANEPRHKISNNVVCATSKGSDQPAHMRSPIRAFACRLNILRLLSY